MILEMTAEELLERYAAGERNFAGVDLGGSRSKNIFVKLGNSDLRGINLSGANLEMASFGLSDLSGARLFGACLSYSCLAITNFTGADLRYATIDWSNARQANFTNANMRGINLIASNFAQTIWCNNDFRDAILIRVNLSHTQGWGSGNFYNALFWNTIGPNGDVIKEPERYAY